MKDIAAEPLAKIWNTEIISYKKFPTRLKLADITPLYKKLDNVSRKNYRPVSLLPLVSKIFERIMYDRLSSFITKYKILFGKQYGFQSGKSTEHALIDIQQNILNAMEKREHPCCVFLDFTKAFDTVNHSILLQKLNPYGIRGNTLKLIESYIADREQCVFVNNTYSDLEKNSHGVPQGSILGPLFFLLYINDISNCSPLLTFYLFADDTTIFLSHKSLKTLESTLN